MIINAIVGVCIPIIRIPIKGGMTIPNIGSLDRGAHVQSHPIFFLQPLSGTTEQLAEALAQPDPSEALTEAEGLRYTANRGHSFSLLGNLAMSDLHKLE